MSIKMQTSVSYYVKETNSSNYERHLKNKKKQIHNMRLYLI